MVQLDIIAHAAVLVRYTSFGGVSQVGKRVDGLGISSRQYA